MTNYECLIDKFKFKFKKGLRMKKKSRKARAILLAGMFLIGIMPMKSGNLYVYGTNGSKQAFSMTGVQEITFSGAVMVVTETSGGKTAIPLADLQTFSLRHVVAPSTESLYVYGTNGSVQAFPLFELQDLTYSGTAMTVNNKTNGSASFLYDNMQWFSLFNHSFTGMASAKIGSLHVFPNPAIDEVTVKNDVNITDIGLYDIQGRKLVQFKPESLEVRIPFSSYPAGIYMLRIVDQEGITIKKIVKN
jgi:hypothetical protein